MCTLQPDARVVPHSAVLASETSAWLVCVQRVRRVAWGVTGYARNATRACMCCATDTALRVLSHPGHVPEMHVCACDGQGTECASHPRRMLCVHVCALRRTRHCVCFASGTRALRALGGKRKRLSVRAVCASQHAPLCACSLFLLELRDLTLLSLSPKSCGRELHSQLCPHIMVCMDVRSMLPNTKQ